LNTVPLCLVIELTGAIDIHGSVSAVSDNNTTLATITYCYLAEKLAGDFWLHVYTFLKILPTSNTTIEKSAPPCMLKEHLPDGIFQLLKDKRSFMHKAQKKG
jgi:hypothetical protein